MDNGLGRHQTDSGTEAQGTSRGGGGFINPGACLPFPTGCSWIYGASGAPPHITDPPLFGAMVWPGLVQLTAKADGTMGGCRLGMRCAWAVMWVMEAHRHALASTGHTSHIYLVRECNVGFMVVHSEYIRAGHGEAL